MAISPKVPNQDLAAAGLALMAQNGKQLERVEAKGRAMIYRTQHGESVRIRTCNDHVLVVLADSADENAKLNVEGTDQILIVMPEVPRMRGNILAYLVPTEVVVEAARTSHTEWLRSRPATNGHNRTWNLWFDEDGLAKSNGFRKKWAKYSLSANFGPASTTPSELPDRSGGQKLGDVIADAKRRIAAVAGISEGAIKISIDLS